MKDPNKKINEQIERLETELKLAITKKSHGVREVNIADHMEQINRLRAKLK